MFTKEELIQGYGTKVEITFAPTYNFRTYSLEEHEDARSGGLHELWTKERGYWERIYEDDAATYTGRKVTILQTGFRRDEDGEEVECLRVVEAEVAP